MQNTDYQHDAPRETADLAGPSGHVANRSLRGPNSYSNPCPVCLARPFDQCRSLTRGRKTDTHSPRVRGEWPAEIAEAHSD